MSRQMLATRSKIAGSVTLAASPLRVRSRPGNLTEMVHAGFDARLRDLRVAGPAGEIQVRPDASVGAYRSEELILLGYLDRRHIIQSV
jgi:hypothetical protein